MGWLGSPWQSTINEASLFYKISKTLAMNITDRICVKDAAKVYGNKRSFMQRVNQNIRKCFRHRGIPKISRIMEVKDFPDHNS